MAQGLRCTLAGLSGEYVQFDDLAGMTPGVGGRYNMLRPEALEACFYLWRVTGKQMYRDWAWAMFQALQQNCKARAAGESLCSPGRFSLSQRQSAFWCLFGSLGQRRQQCYQMRKPAKCLFCGRSCMCLWRSVQTSVPPCEALSWAGRRRVCGRAGRDAEPGNE